VGRSSNTNNIEVSIEKMMDNRHIDLRECVETEQSGYQANGLRNVRQIARQREMENPRYIVPSTQRALRNKLLP